MRDLGGVAAVLCMCLHSPVYTQHCDSVIPGCFPGMTKTGGGLSQTYAQIDRGDRVIVQGNSISFDKNPQILRGDIHMPEKMRVELSQLSDYPPRLLIYLKSSSASSFPQVQVLGLDRECSFNITSHSHTSQATDVVSLSPDSNPSNDEQPLFTKDEQTKKYDEFRPSDLPETGTPKYNFLQKFCSSVTIILQTVNDNEYQAATTVLEKPGDMFDRAVVFPKNGVVLGMFAKNKTALIQTGMGTEARDSIAKAIETFPDARYIIGVGVCYAFNEKYKLGDVLVSKKICDLENVKCDSEGKFEDRGQRVDVVESLQEIFCRNLGHNPRFNVCAERNSDVYSGTFVSHAFLINNKETRDKLHDEIRTAIGGEMEGGQLLWFQQKRKVKGIIIIKGVCDYADKNKSKEWQFISALAALNYTKCKLRNEPSLIDEVKYMDDPPTMEHLVTSLKNKAGKRFNLADKISNCWNTIGLRLGIDHAKLNGIRKKNIDDDVRLQEVFTPWLENAAGLPNSKSYPLSWQGLVTLLEDCEKTEVARKYIEFMKEM